MYAVRQLVDPVHPDGDDSFDNVDEFFHACLLHDTQPLRGEEISRVSLVDKLAAWMSELQSQDFAVSDPGAGRQ